MDSILQDIVISRRIANAIEEWSESDIYLKVKSMKALELGIEDDEREIPVYYN